MTTLIHIVGKHGVGKSALALDIIAGFEKRRKTGLSLTEADLQEPGMHCDLERMRIDHSQYDVLIAEHLVLSKDIQLVKGDVVIHMERA